MSIRLLLHLTGTFLCGVYGSAVGGNPQTDGAAASLRDPTLCVVMFTCRTVDRLEKLDTFVWLLLVKNIIWLGSEVPFLLMITFFCL